MSCSGAFFQSPKNTVQVLVAALGPQALAITGKLADGTSLAWVGPKTIRDHIVPNLNEAASSNDMPPPRVVATLPVCVTDNPEVVRASIDKGLGLYGRLPSYRAMFEREGVNNPSEVAIVGSRAEVEDKIEGLAASGVTDFAPSEYCLEKEERVATREALVDLAAKRHE